MSKVSRVITEVIWMRKTNDIIIIIIIIRFVKRQNAKTSVALAYRNSRAN